MAGTEVEAGSPGRSARDDAPRPEPDRVPAGPPETSLLRRAMPRSVLGMAFVLLCMSIAAAFTGAVLYAFYEYRLGQTEDRVDAFQLEFADRMTDAVDRIEQERDRALVEVRSQLDELERFSASGETLVGLLEAAEPSVWFVTTLDEAGQPSVGSAFVAFSDSGQSFLLTSYTTIRAATQEPGPEVRIRKGGDDLPVELTAWDPANDVALLTVDRPNLPALTWAPPDSVPATGDRIFVVSGLGGGGGSISQGFVAGVSSEGLQHDAPVGAHFQGGPVLDSQGRVQAIASRAYAPLGFSPEAVFFGVPVRNACDQVVRCPDGATPG